MVMKLMSEDAGDIFMNDLREGSSFEISATMIETGGEELDNCFHIVLHASCILTKMTDLCVSFPYTIKIPFEIEQGKSCPNGCFGTSIFIYQPSLQKYNEIKSFW